MKVPRARPPSLLPEVLHILLLLALLAFFLFGNVGRIRVWLVGGDDEPEGRPEVVYQLSEQDRKAPLEQEVDLTERIEAVPAESSSRVLSTRLFFVKFSETGQLTPTGLLREVSFRSSPLTRTMESLLDGPTPREINLGIHTMIPEATQLLNSNLRDGVAFLDFNEAFFNNINVNNVRWAQLRQVVFTATEFESVKSVRFLQQGQVVEKWGNLSLPRPLERKDFF